MSKLLMILAFQCAFFGANGQTRGVTLAQEKSEMVNGCRKTVRYVSGVNSNLDWSEWEKQYLISPSQTCDFSAHVVKRRQYVSDKLIEEKQFIAGCDDCEEKPCGIWIYYDKSGKETKRIDHGHCDLARFDTKR